MTSQGREPMPWQALRVKALDAARHHRMSGNLPAAEGEEKFAAYCVQQERKAALRPGEPPIPGVTAP